MPMPMAPRPMKATFGVEIITDRVWANILELPKRLN
jgi:hypothetical protein